MKYFVFTALLVSLMFPLQMFAQDAQINNITGEGEIVSCQDGGMCSFCDLIDTTYNIVSWVTGIALLIAAIILMYAGYLIVSSRGDINAVTKGRELVGNVAIGIFIVVLAFSIVDILLKTMTGGEFGAWNDISEGECGKSNPVVKPPELEVKNKPDNPGAVIPDTTSTPTETGGGTRPGGSGGTQTGGAGAPDTPVGNGFVNDDGFIDAPAPPGSNLPPAYDPDRSGPQ